MVLVDESSFLLSDGIHGSRKSTAAPVSLSTND
jgi:hypothetical protein